MDFSKMSEEICNGMGGTSNICTVAYCATRLRFTVTDDELVDQEALGKVDGVMGVVKSGSQWQLIIGKTVGELYNTFCQLYHIEEGKKKKKRAKDVVTDVATYIQGSVGPMILPLVGVGLIKAVCTVLVSLNVVDAANATYTFFMGAADVGLYYMPVLLAYGASKQLGCNQLLATMLGLIMVNPTYTAAVAAGEGMSIFGITVVPYTFSNQFLPVLIAVPIFAAIEKFLKKHTPEILSMIVVPTVSLAVMILIIFLVIGPIMNGFSTIIEIPAAYIARYKILIIPIMSMMWSVLTLFGAHGAVYWTLNLMYFSQLGYDPVCLTSYLATHLTIGTVAITSAFLTKNKEEKQVGISTGITMLVAGISEPALFGVLIRDKRLYAAHLTAAFIAGLYGAIAGVANFVVGSTADLCFLPTYIGEGSTLVEVLIMVVIAMACSVFFTVLYMKAFPSKSKKEELTAA